MFLSRAILISFLLSFVAARRGVRIQNICGPFPTVPHTGPGCGIPEYVDPEIFGDNNNSRGILSISPRRSGLRLDIRLFNLSRPDHILTAWLVWTDPNDPNRPDVFKGPADIVSPCAPFNAAFTSGFGREPNQFQYVSRTEARLTVNLNFNPTFPGEGALARGTYCFQKDIPGIQNTEFRQFPLSRGGGDVFVPTTSAFLRRYDPRTGFELLDRRGNPEVVRSPTSAMMVAVASHIDLATHGISPGAFMFDHFELMAFPVQDVQVGRRTV